MDFRGLKAVFTLVELLVVVAIMGALIAMILPALRSAKEKARQSACESNLKQQFLAFSMYADDWGDFYPAICAPPLYKNHWFQKLSVYTKNDWPIGVKVPVSKINASVFHCPPFNPPQWNCTGYGMNGWWSNSGSWELEGKRSQVKNPSALVLVTDIEGYWVPLRAYPSGTVYFGSPQGQRHNMGTNSLFHDGHVSWLPWQSQNDGLLK